MSIVIACAMQKSWCEFVEQRLCEMGIRTALKSQLTGLSAHDLVGKMCRSLGLADGTESLDADQEIGRAWEMAASDLILGNVDQQPWGWADPKNLQLLEFWRKFDPNCKFVLVYGAPHAAIAAHLANSEKEFDQISEVMMRWKTYHEGILSFHQSYPDRCVLVDIERFEGAGFGISEEFSDAFGLQFESLTHQSGIEIPAILELIGFASITSQQEYFDLYNELQHVAELPASRNTNRIIEKAESARTQYESMQSSLAKALEASLENARLRTSLNATQSELFVQKTRFKDDINKLRGDLDRTKVESQMLVAKSKSELSKSLKDKELVELQLQQSQSELERYFLKYNELMGNQRAPDQSRIGASVPNGHANGGQNRSSAREFNIDLRNFFEGTGWHNPEPFGRWAGLEPQSTIILPELSGADYDVTLKIVDAISLDHLHRLSLELNDRPLHSKLQLFSEMGGRLAPLRRVRAKMRKVEKPFPASLSARIPAGVLKGRNVLRLYTQTPISPVGSNPDDVRTLSVCFGDVKLVAR